MNIHSATLRSAGLIALLAVTLAACTIYVSPGETRIRGTVRIGIELNEVITRFEPTRGVGSTYYVGEQIAFDLRANSDGYVSLTAIDPDGSVYTLARNIPVRAGELERISGPGPRQVFVAASPTGYHRVRASFSSGRTDVERVTYRGIRGEDSWTNTIEVELRPFPVRDVAETHLYIR